MEPPRSPQEPPLYVSPQSREEQQLVKELQTITGLEAHVAQRRSHRRPARAPTAPAECGIDFVVPIAAPGYRNILSVHPYAIDATPLRYHYRHRQYAPERRPSRPLRPSRAPHIPSIESTQADEAERGKNYRSFLDLCVSSLRRGHANLLGIVSILTDDPRRESRISCPWEGQWLE